VEKLPAINEFWRQGLDEVCTFAETRRRLHELTARA
jgi:hypothetical protein